MTADDLLAAYETAPDPAAALQALDALAARGGVPQFDVGLEYDELADELAEVDELALAVRAQRLAIEHGYDEDGTGRELLAWYLLRSGELDEPERLFAALRAERGAGDPSTDLVAADAYLDCDLVDRGLAALDVAVAIARDGDPDLLAEALVQRREARQEHGIEEDDDDREAATLVPVPPGDDLTALPWFPPDQAPLAAAQWPEVGDELDDAVAYARTVDGEARAVTEALGRRPAIVAVALEAYLAWAQAGGWASSQRTTLEAYAAERHRAGDSRAWPPGRNDPCWCGSGAKYKRCCAA